MSKRKDYPKRESYVRKKMLRGIALVAATLMLVIAPFNSPLNNMLPGGKTIVAQAVGVGLIGGATTNSSFKNGILSIGIHGGAALKVDIAKDYHAQVKLPGSFDHLFKESELAELKKHVKLKYSLPAPLLGFIPMKGEMKGEELNYDLTNNIIQGSVFMPINLSLFGVYKFTFEIDIAGLNKDIEAAGHEFKITVGDAQFDLPLLEFPQSRTTLEFEYKSTDDGDGDGGDGGGIPGEGVSSGRSNATIVFIASDDAPTVVDPTDPTIPYEPTGPTDPQDKPTGNKGALTLDYVSSVDFGEHEIDGQTKKYESTILRPFIQVTDRRGTGEGWAVTAAVSNFEKQVVKEPGETRETEEVETQETLFGSVISFKNGTVISPGNSEAPHPYHNIELYTGGDAAWVIWAESDTGLGSWVNRWFPSEGAALNDNVTLEVPGGAATLGGHTAEITWTLISAPGNE